MLRWSKIGGSKDHWHAERGDMIVGRVVTRDDGVICWAMDAAYTKWICKGRGETHSIPYAKRAVSRAWKTWCDAHGLVPKEAAHG